MSMLCVLLVDYEVGLSVMKCLSYRTNIVIHCWHTEISKQRLALYYSSNNYINTMLSEGFVVGWFVRHLITCSACETDVILEHWTHQ